MAQNTSSAVMAQRHEPSDSLDDFPTPPWATRALCEHVLGAEWVHAARHRRVWDPACGRGTMVRPLKEYFDADGVVGSDIHDYGAGFPTRDYLSPSTRRSNGVDFIVTNPPFKHKLPQAFIEQALACMEDEGTAGNLHVAAFFVRTALLEGTERYRHIFAKRPPAVVAQFTERVTLVKGRLVDPDAEYLDQKTGEMRKIVSATAYCWMVWYRKPTRDPKLMWIPPCRQALTRPGDYEGWAPQVKAYYWTASHRNL
jgi:hypothetical protein